MAIHKSGYSLALLSVSPRARTEIGLNGILREASPVVNLRVNVLVKLNHGFLCNFLKSM